MSSSYAESPFEDAVLEYFREIGYDIAHGPEIGPKGDAQERSSFGEVLLVGRLFRAIARLNPGIRSEVAEAAVAAMKRFDNANLAKESARRYFLLRDGVPVETEVAPGERRTVRVRLLDLSAGGERNNDFLAVNQLRVVEPTGKCRADVVMYLNGIPVAIFELKSPSEPNATIQGAHNQLTNYMKDIPSLMAWPQILAVADGASARVGTVTAALEHFSRWRTLDTEEPVGDEQPQIKVLIHGLFAPERLCEMLARFIDWAETKSGTVARLAYYNQYWGVRSAHASVKRASGPDGDHRGGIVYHGQGSGKSMELLLLANMLARDPEMANPTFVALSDRNDLDDQLWAKEFGPSLILPEPAVKAESGKHLAGLLSRPAGGIIVTTVQKFERIQTEPQPVVLTTRSNVVLGTDEAHRTQYGLVNGIARDIREGLPNATFVAFTGTPIETSDRSTIAVFGDYISRYTPQQSVEDGTTVPIYYEGRVAHIRYTEEAEEFLERALHQIADVADEAEQQQIYGEWSRIKAILGTEPVVKRIAADVVEHWEARYASMAGKAMLVCVSRETAARMYEQIAALRPEWVSDDDKAGRMKVVYTGSSADAPHIRKHVRSADALDALKLRAQDPKDNLEFVIVVDLWLTGFDAPSLNTIYLAKPMRGHTLFQAITRPNRVYQDKPAGLVVGYVPIMDALNEAVSTFTRAGEKGSVGVSMEDAVRALREKHDVVSKILAGHAWTSAPAAKIVMYERVAAAAQVVIKDDERRKRYLDQSLALSKAFAIAGATPAAAELRHDVEFLLAVRGILDKLSGEDELTKPSSEKLGSVIASLVAGSIEADQIIDVYAAAGMDKPEISLLSEEFLVKALGKPSRNLQVEILRKILADGIKAVGRSNVVRFRTLSEILAEVINRYHNQTLTDAEIVAELVALARKLRDEDKRPAASGLSVAELAFYDAVASNQGAVEVLGDAELRLIAQEVARRVRENATLDWRDRESVRAKMRLIVKTTLRNHKYPPDKQEAATELVLEQAQLFSETYLAEL
jgi:type I restriction enzyme R subunit